MSSNIENKLIPSENFDYNEIRIMNINSLQYVWDILSERIEIALKLLEPTIEEERYKKIRYICTKTLYDNIVKPILETRNSSFVDLEELMHHEKSLYARFIPQVKIIHNMLLKAFLQDLKYSPNIYDNSNLKVFNCLNLDLRNLKPKSKISRTDQIVISDLGKDHFSKWYEDRFITLNQFYWTIPHAFVPVRNEGEHGDEDIESKNFDFLTQAYVPANTIIMCQIATFILYFCFEILLTWIQTCKSLGILDAEK